MSTCAQQRGASVAYRALSPSDIELGPARQFLEFWQERRGDAFAPRWGTDFRLADLPTDILPNIAVVDVLDGGRRYFYRFWGTNNVAIKGFEMSQKYLEDAPVASVRENGVHQFGLVVRKRRPMVFLYEAEYRDQISIGCFTLRVPLSADGVTVDKIASYQDLSYRRDARQGLSDNLRQPQIVVP